MAIDVSEFLSSPKVLLAPMAGVSDAVFRSLCLKAGADLTYSEMVSSKGLSYANEKTRHLIELHPTEERIAVQLFGHEPQTMADQARWVEDTLREKLAYIDVNMGCPARKIVTKGDGSALMKDPKRAAEIVSAITKAITAPCAVKFRRGYEVDHETCVDFARRLEDSGANLLTVHGRFAMQLYRGRANWDAIARVVDAVDIPVIGNGDITSGPSALDMLERTGCAALMIGRGAQGNPWIFTEVKAALANTPYKAPSAVQRIEAAREHARQLNELPGKQVVKMRKHAMWYIAGLPGAAAARGRINACATLDDFEAVFDELLDHLPAQSTRRMCMCEPT